MWVTKLLISSVEIRIFWPKTTKFGPKLAFLVNLGQAMQAYSMPCCGSVGGCGARAVSRKTPIYFIYDNTDQKEVTRLGTEWEWATDVTVTREGRFTWSDHMDLDKAEIFEGAENSLTMNQTYTLEFQCKYELQRYPFDSQVNHQLLAPY